MELRSTVLDLASREYAQDASFGQHDPPGGTPFAFMASNFGSQRIEMICPESKGPD
jgi:hypothetical protein